MKNPDEPTDLHDNADESRTIEVTHDQLHGKIAISVAQIRSLGQTDTETLRLTQDEAIALHQKLGTYLYGSAE